MVLGRYVVDAVLLEGRSPTELARSHGLSRTWIYELVKRFRRGGYAALEPRSRRPRSCPHQHGPKVEEARYQSRLRHIALGRANKHQSVRLLIAGAQVRVSREDGSLLRELTIDPGRDYQSLQLSSMS